MNRLFGSAGRAHIAAEQLSAYLDHQVTAAERAHIRTHLRTCETCQRELNSLSHTVALLQALPRMPVPRAFTLSEAQVGISQPAAYPVWLGGALRGLAAVTAIALVAVIAVSVVRPVLMGRESTIARVPSVDVAEPQAESRRAMPAEAPQALMAPAEPAQEEAAPVEKAVALAEEAPAAMAPATVAEQEVAVEEALAADQALMEPRALARPAPEPTAPMPEPEAEIAEAPAAAAEMAPAPALAAHAEKVAPTTEAPSIVAMTPPLAEGTPEMTPEISAMAMGRAVGGEPGIFNAENFTPEPTPPIASVREILAPSDGIVYAVPSGLWVMDGRSEPRLIERTTGGMQPIISPDRNWIVYRVFDAASTELWVASWDGKDVRLLLTDRDLPQDDLGKDYGARRFDEVRWIPGETRLAITTVAVPNESVISSVFDLWTLDADSGDLRYMQEIPSARFPTYSPDGQQFALFEFGTTQAPESRLLIAAADGTGQQPILELADETSAAGYLARAQWLPDDDGLLAAVPLTTMRDDGTTTLALYRISADWESTETGQIEAVELFWAPNGLRLAYLQRSNEDPETLVLMVANGDGTDPAPYETFQFGAFLGWAPAGRYFLYQKDGQVYLGNPRRAPEALGNAASVFDPRWLTADRIVYLMDQGADWVLASRDLAGQSVSLMSLPRSVSYDVTRR